MIVVMGVVLVQEPGSVEWMWFTSTKVALILFAFRLSKARRSGSAPEWAVTRGYEVFNMALR